jgi:hypothetical protein
MRKALFATAAVLSFGTATGAAAIQPAGASAGCGVTVKVQNERSSAVTVQWSQSDSRARLFGIAGPWKKLGSSTTTVQAGDTGSKAFTLDFSCSTVHQYRVHYTHGSSSAYAYFPANTSNWTTSTSPTVHVK